MTMDIVRQADDEWEEREEIFERLRQIADEAPALATPDTAVATPEPAPTPATPRIVVTYAGRPAPFIVHLENPLIADGDVIETIEIQPPAFGDTQAVRARVMTRHEMIAKQAGIDAQVLDALRSPDDERVVGAALLMAQEA
ncbi:MAG: hypothetical protein KAG89_07860 [Fulvimarina manganoxydans]|uniref:hypothetical protein n=1 Tax=Fulvimarina manganoxydans TaxID=937218 RepID=UPI0023545B18|nr:hypothetical protein [Fulvimarina manganoxydans]MCK5932074.1 hypothetical protein [Fulvimarina manganoxydans]